MENANRWIAAIAGGLVLISATCVGAQDWPQWRGANRDGKLAKFAAPLTWPKELTKKWKVTVGTGDATPALVGDKLYVFARQGDEEVTLCLNATTGKELWRSKYATPAVTGPAGSHPGPRSSPTVAGGKVVTLGVNGVVSCVDAATGKDVWRNAGFTKVVPQFATSMSPIVVGKLAIAHLGGKENGVLVAFDLATGNEKWQWKGDGPSYASPVVMTVGGEKQLVVQTEKNLIGISVADGKPHWVIPTPVQGRFYNSTTPIVNGQTIIYTGQGQGTRAVRIDKQGEPYITTELWANKDLGAGYCTPVLKDNMLFGLSDKGSFYCIDAQTGKTSWIDTTTRRDSFGTVLDAGSVIFGQPSNSELVAFKPSGTQYSELARFKVADTAIYASPVISGNKLFVKDQDAITLWTIQ